MGSRLAGFAVGHLRLWDQVYPDLQEEILAKPREAKKAMSPNSLRCPSKVWLRSLQMERLTLDAYIYKCIYIRI